jgi:hypothetical protein
LRNAGSQEVDDFTRMDGNRKLAQNLISHKRTLK